MYVCMSIQFNSIQFNLYFHIKIHKHQEASNNKETKYGGKDRKANEAWLLSIPEKKIVTKHPNNHITKPNKTRRQNKGLCSKERNYS